MGEAGHDRIGVGLGLADQRCLHRLQTRIEPIERIAHPQLQVGRHLIVARARRVQPPGRIADQHGQPRLDIHMDVFEGGFEFKGAALDFLKDRL